MVATVKASQDDKITMDSNARFLNRELSWLSFNSRVLEEAYNTSHPLLERLRFLAISASNLDEFYMVRVAGLKGQVAAGVATPSDDGLTPKQQLNAISNEVGMLLAEQQKCWRKLRKDLEAVDISVLAPAKLAKDELKWLDTWFAEQLFPVLTPLALSNFSPRPSRILNGLNDSPRSEMNKVPSVITPSTSNRASRIWLARRDTSSLISLWPASNRAC